MLWRHITLLSRDYGMYASLKTTMIITRMGPYVLFTICCLLIALDNGRSILTIQPIQEGVFHK